MIIVTMMMMMIIITIATIIILWTPPIHKDCQQSLEKRRKNQHRKCVSHMHKIQLKKMYLYSVPWEPKLF